MNRLRRRLVQMAPPLAMTLLLEFATPAHAWAADPAKTVEQLASEADEEQAAGRYADSISNYLRAYELSRMGVLLLNVATLYDRKLHERELAEDYYRRYLRAPDADPEHVRKATQRLTALKAESDAEEAARKGAPLPAAPPSTPAPASPAPATASPAGTATPTPPSAAAAPPLPPPDATSPVVPSSPEPDASGEATPHGSGLRVAGVVLGAVGVAGLGTSLALGLAARGKSESADAFCSGRACQSEQGVTLARDAGTLATAGTVTFIASLALAAGGIALYVAAPRGGAAPSASVRVAPLLAAGTGGMSVYGSF
jgi:hypothetical protein